MSQNAHRRVFQVSGMTCGHCKSAVESAIRATDGVATAVVDLEAGKAIVEGQFTDQSVVASIQEAGYEVVVSGGA